MRQPFPTSMQPEHWCRKPFAGRWSSHRQSIQMEPSSMRLGFKCRVYTYMKNICFFDCAYIYTSTFVFIYTYICFRFASLYCINIIHIYTKIFIFIYIFFEYLIIYILYILLMGFFLHVYTYIYIYIFIYEVMPSLTYLRL